VKIEAKKLSTSAFLLFVDSKLLYLFSGERYILFNLPFLVDGPVEALLVILCIPCQIRL